MTCPNLGQLAAAATGENALVITHAADCARCGSLVAEQRELLDAARRMRAPRLHEDRRQLLAAEVMAAADVALEPRWRGARVMVAASVPVAAALAILVAASLMRSPDAEVARILPSVAEAPQRSDVAVAYEETAALGPVHRQAELVAHDADYARAANRDHDVVQLREGELAVDARDREPITIVAGDTSVVIARSRAKVVARGGVIVTAQVFAGTAEVTEHGKRRVVDEGEVWMPTQAPPPSVPASAFDTFRIGWQALREGRYADATDAFDRATDPGVAEDAAFWAAIASERAGNSDDATRRLEAFVEKFPASPRLDAARAALERLAR